MAAGPKVVILLGLVVVLKDFVHTAIAPTATTEAENEELINNKDVTYSSHAWAKEHSLTPRASTGGENRRDPDDPETVSEQMSGNSRSGRRKSVFGITSQRQTSYPSSHDGIIINDDQSLAWEDDKPLLEMGIISTHRDVYNCSVSTDCFCHRVENSHGIDRIQANCSSLRLNHIPMDLPNDIYKLTLTENRLRTFNLSVLLKYPELAFVDAQDNKLTSVVQPFAQTTKSSSLLILLLGNNNFRSIGENAFKTLPSLKKLSVNHNMIQSLTNFTFSGLDQLYVLDLSFNDIRHIELATFDSVPNLRTLRLNNNKRLNYYPSHMPPRLFMNLKSLNELNIAGSSGGSDRYPNEALGYLTNLNVLSMDGLGRGAVLGLQVKNLTHLESLKFGVGRKTFCRIGNLTSSFFENTPYLKSLEIQHCLMSQIDSDAFYSTPKLQHLKMSYARNLGFSKALRSLASLQNSSMKSLELVHLVSHNGLPCRYVTEEDSKFIKNMKLELLDLSENYLAMIEINFFKALPQTLKTLVLRNNRFTIGTFGLPFLTRLKNIVKLDLTAQNVGELMTLPSKQQENKDGETCELIPSDIIDSEEYPDGILKEYEYPAIQPPLYNGLLNAGRMRNNLFVMGEATDAEDKTRETMSENQNGFTSPISSKVKAIKLPPSLQILWTSQFILYGELVLFGRIKAKLKEIDFSNSFLSKWGRGWLHGSERVVSLEGNYCRFVHQRFFPLNNSLEFFNIRNNILGPQFANDEHGILFKRLGRVVMLDLSMNLIYRLPPNFFKGLKRLRVLILSDNKLQSLNFRVSSMPDLTTIDASKNSIAWIGKATRDGLDSIALRHPVSLDLRKNPLPCTCKGIEILSWLATTKVHLSGKDFLVCRLEKNHYVTIGDLSLRVSTMRRRCAPLLDVVFISVVCASLFLLLSSFLVVYRCRWKLRYLHKVTVSKWFGFHPSSQTSGHKFDAFILYAEEDRDFVLQTMLTELETNRGHKLCVADRDFMPGTFITPNITCAVQSSTLTLPVVSPDFLDDDYSEYGIQMALCEMVFEKRPVLHLILAVPIDYQRLSRDLMRVLRENKYTEYPPQEEMEDENIKKNFWDALSRVIGHSNSQSEPRLDVSGET